MRAISAVLVSTALFACAPAFAGEHCFLKNTGTLTAQVVVKDENTGNQIWSGAMAPEVPIRIDVTDGRMRYQYKYTGDRDYHSDTGAWCKRGETVTM